MNGENPNNQVNNNLGNYSNSLGNVEPQAMNAPTQGAVLGAVNNSVNPTPTPNVVPPVAPSAMPTPVPNVEPQVQNNVASPMPNVVVQTPVTPTVTPNVEPVAVPIPGTEGTPGVSNLTGNTVGVGTPLMGQDNVNTNAFVQGQKVENIGAMPPSQPTNTKDKKPINKLLFTLFIIALIGLVAFGVYYFLNFSKNKVKLTPNDITVGVGEVLSDNIKDYAKVVKGDVSKCSLNNRNVNVNEIGEYEYSITCNKDVYKGKVIVSDLTAPIAKLNTLFKTVNDSVTVEDFVESCTDPSECKTSIKDEDKVKGYLENAADTPYTVTITATDNAGNTKDYETELYVVPSKIIAFTSCSSQSEIMSNFQASKVVSDILPIGSATEGGLQYLGVSKRKYKYVFTSENEYKEITGNKDAEITFDNVTGKAYYNDDSLTLIIVVDLPKTVLNSENNGEFPVNYADFNEIYTSKGYSCSNNLAYTNY